MNKKNPTLIENFLHTDKQSSKNELTISSIFFFFSITRQNWFFFSIARYFNHIRKSLAFVVRRIINLD